MTKKLATSVFLLFAGVLAFAGDAASFVDFGFSPDSGIYVFGQYGKTDKRFQAYGEIYVVDIAKNDFTPGGIFRISPSASSGNRSSFLVFEELKQKFIQTAGNFGLVPVSINQVLYLRETDFKSPLEPICVEDFERITHRDPVSFEVRLIPAVTGTGSALQSSFYIQMDIKNPAGNIIEQKQVGNPLITRKGVIGYSISRIFTDPSGKSLVFVIEKTQIDDTGPSIRYMVETLRLW
jgi:predicted secreted protein